MLGKPENMKKKEGNWKTDGNTALKCHDILDFDAVYLGLVKSLSLQMDYVYSKRAKDWTYDVSWLFTAPWQPKCKKILCNLSHHTDVLALEWNLKISFSSINMKLMKVEPFNNTLSI